MTVSRFWVSHLDVMFPFPQLVVALMVVAVPCLVRGRGMAWIAAGLVVIALVWNVGLTVHYHRAAARAEPHPMQPWAPLRFDHRTLRINRSLHW